MGGGRNSDGQRIAKARVFATTGGTLLCLIGLAGFLANASFASGDAIPPGSVGPIEVNGWQASFYLAAGLTGLALANPAPRFYCLGAAVIWTLLTGFGFFGAHGGEPIPSMGDRLLATTSNNVIALVMAVLAWSALLASGRQRTGAKPAPPAPPAASSIGRPRSRSRARRSHDPIN